MKQGVLGCLAGIALFLVCVGSAPMVFGNAITVSSSINWSAITTGTGPRGQPSASDSILVNNGKTLTVDVSNGVCASITLSDTTKAGTLVFNSGSVVTNVGDVTDGVSGNPGTITMTAGGTLKIGGTLNFTNLYPRNGNSALRIRNHQLDHQCQCH